LGQRSQASVRNKACSSIAQPAHCLASISCDVSRWPRKELQRGQNVVLQQLEQDIVTNESNSERGPSDGREQGQDFHSVRPQENGPSPFNDGPELIRDIHC
jgi:hypothetical protein